MACGSPSERAARSLVTSVSVRSKSRRDGVESEGWLCRIRRCAGGVKRCDNREDGETRDPWTWAKCAMSRVRAIRPLTLSRTISSPSLIAGLLRGCCWAGDG